MLRNFPLENSKKRRKKIFGNVKQDNDWKNMKRRLGLSEKI